MRVRFSAAEQIPSQLDHLLVGIDSWSQVRSAQPMKKQQAASVNALAAFRELVAPEDIVEAACKLGAIRRQRKVDLPALVEATIAAILPVDGSQTTAFANYIALTGQQLAPSAFYDRFSDEFASLMLELARRAMRAVREAAPEDRRLEDLGVLLSEFSDVQVVDATIVTLGKLAANWAPSNNQKTPAKLKWHTLISLDDMLPVSERITGSRVADTRGLPRGALAPGTLTLMDMGYVDFERFAEASKSGASFIIPAKSNCTARIERVHEGQFLAGSPTDLCLGDALERRHFDERHRVFDLDVSLTRNDGSALQLRAVAIRTPQTGNYFACLTNVPRDVLDAVSVVSAYRLRWSVELFYKQMKSGTGLKAIRATRKSTVLSLLYAKMVALCLARLVELHIEERDGRHATTQLALVLALTRSAPLLLSSMMMSRGVTLEQLEERLLIIARVVARSRNQRRERARRKREQSLGVR